MKLQPRALRNSARGNCKASLNPAFCAAVCDFAEPEAMGYLRCGSRGKPQRQRIHRNPSALPLRNCSTTGT